MKNVFVLLLALAVLVSMAGEASGKHVIKAYFNGREATVTGVKLNVGEPFTVDLDVTPDRYTTVIAILREPGGDEDAYRLVSGDPKGAMVKKEGGPNGTVHFHWVLAPTGDWVDGIAPLNIQYDIWGETEHKDVQGYFTIVEAYISPESYQHPKQAGDDPLIACSLLAAGFPIAAALKRKG